LLASVADEAGDRTRCRHAARPVSETQAGLVTFAAGSTIPHRCHDLRVWRRL